MIGRPIVDVHERIPLNSGWEAAGCAPGEADHHLDGLGDGFIEASVPGTVAQALLAAGVALAGRDLDAEDWWFRCTFAAPPEDPAAETTLRFDGLATLTDVWLNGEHILSSENMFHTHEVPVDGRLSATNELVIGCRALSAELERKRPRARWRTRLVAHGGLRAIRTTLLGRIPAFAPEPAPVGVWRPISLHRRRRIAVESAQLRTTMDGSTGVATARLVFRSLGDTAIDAVALRLDGPSGSHSVPLETTSDDSTTIATGELRIADIARWWPHTHGEPNLHHVRVAVTTAADPRVPIALDWGLVGFRSLEAVVDPGLELRLNGSRVFCRGGALMPDLIKLQLAGAGLRERLVLARDAGMNMFRLSGTAIYASDELLELCDELGILVWQDFAFANLDYPIDDAAFRASVEAEAAQFLAHAGRHVSLTVLCGNSEIEQQVAMLGLDPVLGRGALFGEVLPRLVAESGTDAVYVQSSPSGGELPFSAEAGVAHYFGVGAYRRPLDDARRAEVGFASECLAFANVPDAAALAELGGTQAQAWEIGVPQDNGADWDFADVRDHYLAELYRVDPAALRAADPDRYVALSQIVTGEVMAATFGDWRRQRSTCAGGLLWWLNDVVPGSGWGVIDAAGRPKPAYWYLKRALAPVSVWLTDEGTNGVAMHVANDFAAALHAELRIALYRPDGLPVAEGAIAVSVDGHTAIELSAETVLGRFADVGYAFRFGPPEHNVVVANLSVADETVAEAFHFPLGRPTETHPIAELGLECAIASQAPGCYQLEVSSKRLAYAVDIAIPGFRPADNRFSIAPGTTRSIGLTATGTDADSTPSGVVRALNGIDCVAVDGPAGRPR